MREVDPRTKRALKVLLRHPTLAMKALAADLGLSYRTIASWVEPDGPVPTVDQLRQLVQACARYDDTAARLLAEDVFGLTVCRWFLAGSPQVSGTRADVVHEVLEAGAATGAVTGWLAEAAAGGFSPGEAEEGCRLILSAQRELAEAKASLETYKAPQLRLAGVAA